MIKKILVANRGEIAVRVMRSSREMGIKTVAVYSEADRTSRHVSYADEACLIGPAPSNESYLLIDNIIEAAKITGADAIHPGYGFLSENVDLADRCDKEGIVFIGPRAESIRAMGDKITARQRMIKAGVPIVPGTKEKLTSEKKALDVANKIGYPIMVKASAGGGGKGMRLVKSKNELWEAVCTARSEALSSFGDDTVYLEKYIESPHHIEFQVLGDKFGNVIHLCERECSIQRRHQKLVEETPSPLMTEKLRKEMGKVAVKAAKSVKYIGAGTIEFLVDDDHHFFFLEMNTRLQVEHPVTEQVLGVDLVKEQIKIADGNKLTLKQKDVVQRGHSIECRICAEDAENEFSPCPGIIKHITEPLGLGVRVDSYVYDGYEIPVYYDPMISKLIVWALDRNYAIKRIKRALYEYKIVGVKTNIGFLRRVFDSEDFVKGKYNTHFIEKNYETMMKLPKVSKKMTEDVAIIAAYIDYVMNLEDNQSVSMGEKRAISKWKDFGKQKGLLRI
ncbi:MAG: acetyl-CoA carboxylase biotin carboxylase subunit [Bacteroidales bacterium]|jgi:acetyl-CoA carboxylase biotin carboxylase subunit